MLENLPNYTLGETDFIEAQQLSKLKDRYSWTKIAFILLFLSLSLVEIYRVKDPDFLVLEFAKIHIRTQADEEHIINFLFAFLGSILLFIQYFPQYNPISRWNISRKYQQDFIKQETKTLIVDKVGITRKSKNYCEFIKWSGYTKFTENKNIFLLFTKKENNIVPKRIFTTEEQLESFRTMLNDKIINDKIKQK